MGSRDDREIIDLLGRLRSRVAEVGEVTTNQISLNTQQLEKTQIFMEKMMASFDDLVREVRESNDAVDAAIVLIQGLKDKIQAAGVDPAKLDALVADLDAQQGKLSGAFAEVPAVVEPAPVPEPAPDVPPSE